MRVELAYSKCLAKPGSSGATKSDLIDLGNTGVQPTTLRGLNVMHTVMLASEVFRCIDYTLSSVPLPIFSRLRAPFRIASCGATRPRLNIQQGASLSLHYITRTACGEDCKLSEKCRP